MDSIWSLAYWQWTVQTTPLCLDLFRNTIYYRGFSHLTISHLYYHTVIKLIKLQSMCRIHSLWLNQVCQAKRFMAEITIEVNKCLCNKTRARGDSWRSDIINCNVVTLTHVIICSFNTDIFEYKKIYNWDWLLCLFQFWVGDLRMICLSGWS